MSPSPSSLGNASLEPDGNAEAPTRNRLDWTRLFFEFVIVVVGISLSFWIQDWREQAAMQKEETRYLKGFTQELRTDLEILRKRMDLLKRVSAGIRASLDPTQRETLTVTQLDQIMDAALTYAGIAPSKATYTEFRQTGGSKLFKDKALLADLIHLYERDYNQATEWGDINRDFVLDRMFPYIEEHGPGVSGSVEGTMATGYHVVFLALEHEQRFRNLLTTNVTFKDGQRAIFGGLVTRIEEVLARLEP